MVRYPSACLGVLYGVAVKVLEITPAPRKISALATAVVGNLMWYHEGSEVSLGPCKKPSAAKATVSNLLRYYETPRNESGATQHTGLTRATPTLPSEKAWSWARRYATCRLYKRPVGSSSPTRRDS